MPLNRYEEFGPNQQPLSTPHSTLGRTTSYKMMAKALYNFQVSFGPEPYGIKMYSEEWS